MVNTLVRMLTERDMREMMEPSRMSTAPELVCSSCSCSVQKLPAASRPSPARWTGPALLPLCAKFSASVPLPRRQHQSESCRGCPVTGCS